MHFVMDFVFGATVLLMTWLLACVPVPAITTLKKKIREVFIFGPLPGNLQYLNPSLDDWVKRPNSY